MIEMAGAVAEFFLAGARFHQTFWAEWMAWIRFSHAPPSN